MDISFINTLGEEVVGPVQREEGLLLFGLTRVIRPRVVVELGYGWGASASVLLAGLAADAELYSVDVAPKVPVSQRTDVRFHFVNKDLRDLAPADIQDRTLELLFFDAAHDSLETKQTAYDSLADNLSAEALVIIHDTGVWRKEFMGAQTVAIKNGTWITPDLYVHQPNERAFAKWLVDQRGYRRIDLFSTRCFRHGLSILQKPQW